MKNNKTLSVKLTACLFLLFACFYMYDFYKSLSGFIANGFREPLVMLPMITSFFLPVICFLFFFYDFFVHPLSRGVSIGYSVFVILYATLDIVLIFSNISLYSSNNSLGAYNSLPSIILHFPYDMIAILTILAVWQILKLFVLQKEGSRTGAFIQSLKIEGSVQVCKAEYIALSVLAIIVFVFAGAGIYAAISAIENALYDMRYIYLLIWVALIPLGNLLIITLKPEKMNISKRKKLTALSLGIGLNIIFGSLFAIFELTAPDFLVYIGKPLFLITFSVSLPIEPLIIFMIMALGTLFMIVRLVITAMKKERETK